MPSLFSPYELRPNHLRNRIVMAPMTRARTKTNVPDANTALYYRQRAGAGLIVTEGLHISAEARGQVYTPAIYLPDQVAAWRLSTDAVHAAGSVIFAQLWHVGRLSHVSLQPDGQAPVGVTSKRHDALVWAFNDRNEAERLPVSAPRSVDTDEIARLIEDFVQASHHAIAAGFDGVELHGANGYLIEQFINAALNDRDDRYGGSTLNRLRFVLELVDAVAAAIGAERTGIRLSPFGRAGGLKGFPDEDKTWLTLASSLSARGLAYVHISDQHTIGGQPIPADFMPRFRTAYRGTLIVAGGFLKANGQAMLDSGGADLIAIGQPFIANPDLVERLRHDWPLAEADRSTFYSRGPKGYVDYPAFQAA